MKQITINQIPIELEKKKIKNMYLRIMPPDGRVRVSAPFRMSEREIKHFVLSKLEWIDKHRIEIRKNSGTAEINYETGDMIFLWGKEYGLIIKEGGHHNKVELNDGKIYLFIRQGSSAKQREQILYAWYKEELHKEIPILIAKWEPVIGVKSNSWTIRNMKTRWGTCNIQSHKLSFNLQLAKKELPCLEYVVVHELTHLLEKTHNHVFKGYMDYFMPEWRTLKKKLNETGTSIF